MANQLTTKQKCEKLAKMLEIVATKMRDPDLGENIWEMEEPSIQVLVSQVSTLLSAAKKVSSNSTKNKAEAKLEENEEWPDIIS